MAATETTKDSISSDDVVENVMRNGNPPLPPVRKPTAATKVGSLAVDFYSAYCKSKCEEWSLKGAYPLVEKVAQLMSNPSFCLAAWPPAKNYYSFAVNSQSHQQQQQQQPQQQNHHVITNHLTETLHHLGWTAIDALDTRAFDKLQLAGDNLLLVGPDVGAALRQRTDSSRFACSLAFWEQRLPCLETYWQLYEAMESFELSLLNFSGMGLLNNPQQRRCSYRDFLLPSVHLGEVWGRRLSRFLKAHDRYRLTRAAAPTAGGKSGSVSAVVAELAFSPLSSGDKSGRRRLNQLEEMKDSEQVRELLSLSGASWFSLVLQACPETQMLVIGRRFVLETFLLLAPRRNPVAFGFAAFFHPGLVRVRASMFPGKKKQPQKPQEHDEEEALQQQQLQQQVQLEVIEPCRDQTTFTWLPEQLSDYLAAAVKPSTPTEFKDWLTSSAYPQVKAACAYLTTALAQQVTDSAHVRYHLLRLSFVVEVSRKKDGRERRRIRLDDISQRLTPQPQAASSSQAAATAIDYCESLVLPRLIQESALILSELLVRSTHTGDLPARELTSPQNMCPVYDSVDPSVQREILARNWKSC